MTWQEVPIDEETAGALIATTGDAKLLVLTGTNRTFVGVSNPDKWQEIDVNA